MFTIFETIDLCANKWLIKIEFLLLYNKLETICMQTNDYFHTELVVDRNTL